MKHIIAIGGALLLLAGMTAQAQVVNLNDYDNFAASGTGQFNPYIGPGAYPGATANDFWNGFGLESNGNNPYPATGALSDSTGTPTAMTYDISYDFNGGGLYLNPPLISNGTPGFLFGEAASVSGTDVGTLTLHGVGAGSYDLYLYGANYDGTRGALFTVSSGTAVSGLTATTNPYSSSGSGPLTTFQLGVDYVEFTGVTPDANGNIAITWTQNVNDPLGGGEGDFNGMSLVTVPEPTTMAFMGLALMGLLAVRRRR